VKANGINHQYSNGKRLMMKDLLMFHGVATLLDVCAAVKQGESVLIVTDMLKYEIARVLAAASIERGA